MPVDVSGRIRDRARELRRRRLRLAGVLLLVVALVAGAVWLVTASPVFSAKAVTVTGTSILKPDAVRSAAAVPLGRPLVGIDTDAVLSRVEQIPAVERAEVGRTFPSTITVKVTERSLTYVVKGQGGFLWVDATGHVFNTTKEQPKNVLIADVRTDDPRLLAGVGTVARALPGQVRSRTKVITAQTADSIGISLTDGARIVWGSSEQSDLKAQVIVPLLSVKAKVYDVSAPTQPTTSG